jgi:hypothetical protein
MPPITQCIKSHNNVCSGRNSSSFFLLSQEGLFTLLLLSLSFSVFFFLISPKKWNGASKEASW